MTMRDRLFILINVILELKDIDEIKVVFSSRSEKFRDTVALSFVCGNYCPTMN